MKPTLFSFIFGLCALAAASCTETGHNTATETEHNHYHTDGHTGGAVKDSVTIEEGLHKPAEKAAREAGE